MLVLLAPSKSGHTWVLSMLRSWQLEVESLEAIPPELYHARVRRDIRQTNTEAVINIRDYLNYAASWIWYRKKLFEVIHGLDTWYRLAREAVGDTDIIEDPKQVIYYDGMVADQSYRKTVCAALGGAYSEECLDKVPVTSPGSSFDGFGYQDRGSEMKVLERWRWFYDGGREFIPILKDRPHILKFYLDHFPVDDEKRQMIKKLI